MKKNLILLLFISSITFSQRVVGYYPHWVFNNFAPEDIDLNVVTHVIHAFAWPNNNGSISSYDGMFGSGISDIIHEQDRKFLLSLGGWGNDGAFEVISADAELRELFINNLISVLLINGYDGADLDWEFPDSESDRTNLNLLVSEMDSMFHAVNPELLITMAIPVSHWWGQWNDFEFLTNHVDFYNAMTYGTHGDWSSHAGHLSPLYASPVGDPDGSCHTNMDYLINSRSIPASKINLGLSVGLKGKGLERLNKYRKGYPVYVWPCESKYERLLLDAGLTGITDDLSPDIVTLDTGHARWTKPATQPLTPDKRKELDDTAKIEHKSIISEFKRDVTPWHELTDKERINFVNTWRKKWSWERKIDSVLMETTATNMPWEVSRIIGHRGTGKTHSK